MLLKATSNYGEEFYGLPISHPFPQNEPYICKWENVETIDHTKTAEWLENSFWEAVSLLITIFAFSVNRLLSWLACGFRKKIFCL